MATVNEPTADAALVIEQANDEDTGSSTTQISLGDRMKSYEAVYESHLPQSNPTIVRLDGHSFSKFTAHFKSAGDGKNPFDERIHSSLIQTTCDLLTYFPSATLAYTQSDEITLVCPEGLGGMFNERIQKIASLAAGYTSTRFNYHLQRELAENPQPALKDPGKVIGVAHFDARLFVVPSKEECLNCLIWRCRGDAVRNAISGFARTVYSAKQMHGKTSKEVVQMLKDEKGIIFEDAVPRWAPQGSMVKKILVEFDSVDIKTGENVKAVRTRTKVVDRGMTEFSQENLKLISDKYWDNDASYGDKEG